MDDKRRFENKRWEEQNQPLEFWHQEVLRRMKRGWTGIVLDIGCGDGLLLNQLRTTRGIRCEGIEISASGLKKARSKGLTVYEGDITKSDIMEILQGRSFDAITMLEVLEHVFSPQDVLRNVRQMLKADGSLYVSTPNFNAVGERLRVLRGLVPWQKRHGKGHVYWMNEKIFRALIESAGFEIVEFVSLGYRRNKLFELPFAILAKYWPSLFALSFFVHARPRSQ